MGIYLDFSGMIACISKNAHQGWHGKRQTRIHVGELQTSFAHHLSIFRPSFAPRLLGSASEEDTQRRDII